MHLEKKGKQANKIPPDTVPLYANHAVASHCVTKTGITTWGQSEVRHALIWPLWPQPPPPSSLSSTHIVRLQGRHPCSHSTFAQGREINFQSFPQSWLQILPVWHEKKFSSFLPSWPKQPRSCCARCPKDSCPHESHKCLLFTCPVSKNVLGSSNAFYTCCFLSD